MAGQKADHHAAVRRIEMLNQDEGHAGVGRERAEQFVEGLQPTGRGAETYHQEVVKPGRMSRSTAARSPPAGAPHALLNRHGF